MKNRMRKKISFVVPVYNVVKYLPICLSSLTQLTGDDVEIILIDDGSTDGSGDICDECKKRDYRVRVIHQKNQGVSVARNLGIKMSDAEWICFVDGDDWIHSDFLTILSPYLSNKYDIIFFQFDEVHGAPGKAQRRKATNYVEEVSDFTSYQRAVLNKYLQDYYVASPWAKVFRKEFIIENDLHFKVGLKKAQDTLFVLEAYGKANLGLFLSSALYCYNVHSGSVSRRFTADVVETEKQLIASLTDVINQEENIDKHLDSCLNIAIVRYFMACIQVNFCHVDNPKTYPERKSDFLQTKNTNPFSRGIQCADMCSCRFLERALTRAIRMNAFFMINSLFKARGLLRKHL